MKYILSLATMLAICSFSFSQKTDDEIKKIMESSKNVVLNLNASVINKDGAFIIPVPKQNEELTWKSKTNCKCENCKCVDCKCIDGICKCCDGKNCTNCTTGNCAVVPVQVATNKKIVVISAPDWCIPCQMLEKETLSNDQLKSLVTIERHDGDKEPNIVSSFGVTKYPTIVYFEDNKEMWRVQEFIKPEFLLQLINKKSTTAPVTQAPLVSITGNCVSGSCATSSVMYSAPMTYSGNFFSGNRVFSGGRIFSSGNCSSGNCNR